MGATTRDKAVYVTARDAGNRGSKSITVRGYSRERIIRFLVAAVRFGLDDVERATWKRPKTDAA